MAAEFFSDCLRNAAASKPEAGLAVMQLSQNLRGPTDKDIFMGLRM